MQDLIEWVNQRLKKKDMHPLMMVATFVYEFLSIHPYQDGNGRLSRLLTSMLLMRQDYKFIQYVSFENVIEKRKDEYYKALMECQKNRYKENERIDLWMLFFLESLIILTKRLEVKLETYNKLKFVLNVRQQQIIEYIKEHKTIRISNIEQAMPNQSRNTLKKDLSFLVKEGMIFKTGERKGTQYHLKE